MATVVDISAVEVKVSQDFKVSWLTVRCWNCYRIPTSQWVEGHQFAYNISVIYTQIFFFFIEISPFENMAHDPYAWCIRMSHTHDDYAWHMHMTHTHDAYSWWIPMMHTHDAWRRLMLQTFDADAWRIRIMREAYARLIHTAHTHDTYAWRRSRRMPHTFISSQRRIRVNLSY